MLRSLKVLVGAGAFALLLSSVVAAQETVTPVAPPTFTPSEGVRTPDELEANKLLAARVVEVLSTGDYAVLDEIVAEDYIQNGAGRPSTREGLRATYAAYRAAFPDIQWTIDFIVAEGDYVFAYTTITGTQEGEFNGIPATGRAGTIHTADLWRIEDGMLAEHWDVVDNLSLLQQLGVLPQ